MTIEPGERVTLTADPSYVHGTIAPFDITGLIVIEIESDHGPLVVIELDQPEALPGIQLQYIAVRHNQIRED